MTTHDDDTDPTGMRALLRGLPDPGPMPDDLTDRITASLAALGPLESGETADSHDVGDVSRGTVGPSTPSWWARHGSKAAIAAVFLIGGGAVASGPLGLLGSGSANDATTAGSAGSAARQSDTFAEADSGAPGPQSATPDSAEARGGGDTIAGEVIVRHSGRDYTAATLATQLESQESLPTTSPLTAEAPAIGPIGTEIGVRSCLEGLGLPRDTAADVDLGTFNGTPTAVLVVTLGGGRTAYAVGRDCTTGHPSVLAGPITLP